MVRSAPPVREPDPREEADWFRRLPEHAQEEFRARWRAESSRSERRLDRRRRTLVLYSAEGVLLFALGEFIILGLGAGRLLALSVPGLALGGVCCLIRADRWRYALVATAFYFVVYGLFGLLMISHFIVFVCLATAIGFSHEQRRAEGIDGL